ncbi:MAG: transporter substrate-binding protein [Geminicoccaceae bacterium]|jgi:putative ABC transport system substrate-binding protein|nr:transporter substrate-binding protein [Geminicoccaceae bacterium]MDF2766800.1 transporter substrate-binding protein [Rhodospirillales bacterium]
MRRREFVAVLGGSATWPLMARAQQPSARQPRLGILLYSTPRGDPNLASFLRALGELGYVDRQTINIEYRYAKGRPERLNDLAAELVRLEPDLLFGLGGDVSVPAVRATSSLPILFGSSADPVQLGLVRSLARPEGNATGVSFLLDDLASKRMEYLREAAPRISRVAFVWNPDHPDNELPEAQRAAATLGVELHQLPVHRPEDIDGALRAASAARADALYVVSSRQTARAIPRFVSFATSSRIPLAGGWGAWAREGGLLSYGPNLDEMMRSVAGYADRILRGAKPAELPVQQPTRFELVINLATAKALGLTIPPTLLARADKVIE